MLKPDIREHLAEELRAIDKTTPFLEKNRHEQGLGQKRVSVLFRELRLDLEREIDLAAEQAWLVAGATPYTRRKQRTETRYNERCRP